MERCLEALFQQFRTVYNMAVLCITTRNCHKQRAVQEWAVHVKARVECS